MNIAVFPGSFDPITNGHLDIIRRGVVLFDRVIVAVAESSNKKPLFSLENRVEFVLRAVKDIANVEVKGFANLLVDFCKDNDAKIIIRGVRTTADIDFELQMANMNKRLVAELETIFLPTGSDYSFISSSLVKEIAAHGGDISKFVDKYVLEHF